MDRFKFRIFDHDSETMYYAKGEEEGVELDGNGDLVGVDVPGLWVGGMNCELMQSTGRKDNDGKLMYEHDIVETWKFSTGETARKVIAWCPDRCGFRLYSIDHIKRKILNCPQSMVNVTTLKVLGNMYENPELLEE